MQRRHESTKAGVGNHLGFGVVRSSAAFWASICDWACARVAPGLSRAIIWMTFPPECRSAGKRSCARDASGKYSWALEERKRKPGRQDADRPFSDGRQPRILRPITCGSALKCFLQ